MHRLITILVLLCMALPTGYAKKDKPPKETVEVPILPPTPQSVDVEVLRGQKINIPLRAVARTEPSVRFILRSTPAHGALGKLTMTGISSATLTYSHSGEPNASQDGFLFAARSSGSGVSAAVKVNIRILERPPEFTATQSIDFGSVHAGGRVTREITLQNRGGGVASGQIMMPEAWELDGTADYTLERQEERTFKVTFCPKSAREYRDRIAYSSAPRIITSLAGVAFEPFTVTPESIDITDRTAQQDVSLTISNRTSKPTEAMITANACFGLPETSLVQPDAPTVLPVDLTKNTKTAMREKITIAFGDRTLTVPVKIVALPAAVTVQPSNSISLPEVTVGRLSEQTITVHNNGGTPAGIVLDAPPPFTFPNHKSKVSLAPDATETILIQAVPAQIGNIKAVLTLTTDTGTVAIPITLTALPLPDSKPSPPSSKTSSQKPSPPNIDETPGKDEDIYVPGVWKPTPPVKYDTSFKIIKATPVSLTLEWPSKLAPNAIHRIEVRHALIGPTGHIVFDWHPFENATFIPGDGVMRVRLYKLAPHSRYRLRLFSHLPHVTDAQPAYIPPVSTPASKPSPIRMIHVLLALVVISGTAVLTKRLRR